MCSAHHTPATNVCVRRRRWLRRDAPRGAILMQTRARLRRVLRCCASLCAIVVCAGCNTGGPTVEFYLADDYRFSQAERSDIEGVARSTALEARRLLPTLPQDLVIRVYAGSDIIPESGERASIVPPATVIWVVDPQHEGGVTRVVDTWLRATLLHEWHHLVRAQTVTSTSLMDAVISEGMATVFERDVGGVAPPWGMYPDDVADWVVELMALPADADGNLWLRRRHPDGRLWVGMRAGAYLVDRAMKRSGRTAAELVAVTTEEILALAGASDARLGGSTQLPS